MTKLSEKMHLIKASVTNLSRLPQHIHSRSGSTMLMPRSTNYVHVDYVKEFIPAHFRVNHIWRRKTDLSIEKISHADYLAELRQKQAELDAEYLENEAKKTSNENTSAEVTTSEAEADKSSEA
jgi:hypothetical protein